VERQVNAALEPPQRHAVLERYLNLATRGLWGQKKLEVKRELDGNIREMALEFSIAGLNEHDSIQRALEEFGAPQKVSVGMSKVYTGPVILRNTFLTAIIASICISGFSASRAAIESTDRFPVLGCADKTVKSFKISTYEFQCEGGDYWLTIASIKAELEPKGVTFEPQTDLNGSRIYSVAFPGGHSAQLQTMSNVISVRDWGGSEVVLMETQPDSVRVQDFFTFLQSTGLSVTFENSNPIRIKVGETVFEINATSNPNHTIFESLMEATLENFFPAKPVEEGVFERLLFDRGQDALPIISGFQKYAVRIKIPKPGASYLVISRETSKHFFDSENLKNIASTSRRVRIAKLDQNSSFTYSSIAKSLQVQSELKTRKELATKGLFIEERFNLQATTPDQPGQVMLLEFTGRLDTDTFKILTPNQFSISAK
jgi:hypothetical protein